MLAVAVPAGCDPVPVSPLQGVDFGTIGATMPTSGCRLQGALVRLVTALLLVTVTPAVLAQPVYRCTDDAGRVSFQQTRCPGAGGAIDVPPVNVVEGSPLGEVVLRAEAQRNALVRQAIAARRVLPGMTPAEVRQAWGTPAAARIVVGDDGEAARWVYSHDHGVRRIVHLRDGVVVGAELQQRVRGDAAPRRGQYSSEKIEGRIR